MTSRWRFKAIYFFLAAWYWCAAGVFAQERPASAQPEGAGRPAVAASSANPWDNKIEWVERRYKIEAVGFKARDETGIDWLGSDEVVVGTFDAKGSTTSERIGDIDSGDRHRFDRAKSCIVSVRPGTVILGKTSVCDDGGEPAPLGFRVEFWEKDPFPAGFCPPATGGGPGGHYRGGDCLNDGGGDDFIGLAQVDLSAQDLEARLPQVGRKDIETVVLDVCGDGSGGVCGGADFPDYSFTYLITRLPDVRVDLRSVLDEAMKRSGIGSELEAIAAGLRSLRAPSPRKIEPETDIRPPER